MILMGFRYLASSIPTICLTGVAIGVGLIFASLVLSMSGFIGLVYSLLLLSALIF